MTPDTPKPPTPDAYWDYVKRTVAEVAKWPVWKRGADTGVRAARIQADKEGKSWPK